jgi:hypothetical protein
MELSKDNVTSQWRILLQKLLAVLPTQKFSVFNGNRCFKLSSQNPGTGPYLLSDEYGPGFSTLKYFFWIDSRIFNGVTKLQKLFDSSWYEKVIKFGNLKPLSFSTWVQPRYLQKWVNKVEPKARTPTIFFPAFRMWTAWLTASTRSSLRVYIGSINVK